MCCTLLRTSSTGLMDLSPSTPQRSCSQTPLLKRTPSRATLSISQSSKKKRRFSIQTFDFEATELGAPPASEVAVEETDADRFLAVRGSTMLPLNTTPRTNRIAKSFGLVDDRVLNCGETSATPAQTKVRSILRRCASELLDTPRTMSAISAKSNLAVRKQFVMALDGPGISLNLFASPMAWSHSNCIGVAFKLNVYFQNLDTRVIVRLCGVPVTDGVVHSVDWGGIANQHILALGTTCGVVQAWDSLAQKQVVDWSDDDSPVGGIHWNGDLLAVGRKDGRVSLFDIRASKQVQQVEGHRRHVIGAKWSPDGRYLATGDQSGSVHVWDIRAKDHVTVNDRKVLMKHEGPVKAISWAPWQGGLLATGGLFPDGKIQLWNIHKPNASLTIPTDTNVTALHWSPHCKEILSTHGLSWEPWHVMRRSEPPAKQAPRTSFSNSMTVHAYPSCDKIVSVHAHSAPIGHACIGPDGCSIFTVSPVEETIKMFKVWSAPVDKGKDDGGMSYKCAIR
ncbi:WD40-repeat-containing domain protein [Pisolithus albus]|nr:WD40-repeat-containing domain protein [Pisolithus albus]